MRSVGHRASREYITASKTNHRNCTEIQMREIMALHSPHPPHIIGYRVNSAVLILNGVSQLPTISTISSPPIPHWNPHPRRSSHVFLITILRAYCPRFSSYHLIRIPSAISLSWVDASDSSKWPRQFLPSSSLRTAGAGASFSYDPYRHHHRV